MILRKSCSLSGSVACLESRSIYPVGWIWAILFSIIQAKKSKFALAQSYRAAREEAGGPAYLWEAPRRSSKSYARMRKSIDFFREGEPGFGRVSCGEMCECGLLLLWCCFSADLADWKPAFKKLARVCYSITKMFPPPLLSDVAALFFELHPLSSLSVH